MGFHAHFAQAIANVFNKSKVNKVAFLGDQEIVLESGISRPLDEYLLKFRPVQITVFEHPKQVSKSNKNSSWRYIDLSHSNYKEFQCFDMIIDGGTLEHVANMASAFFSVWQGLSPGGYFIAGYPINNLCDHGYWLPQPRFFADFFRVNNASEVDLQIIKFPINNTDSSLTIFPYTQGQTGQMNQPEWAKCEGQLGVFMIARKKLCNETLDLIIPSDF